MAKKKTKIDYHRHKTIGFRLEAHLVDALRELAKRNRRSATGELSLAIEAHLAKHPPDDK